MRTLTLRNVPDEVVDQLVVIAKATRQSMNGVAVQAIRRSLGLDAAPRRKRDLSAFCGDWTRKEAAEFEQAVAIFEEIDAELWKSEPITVGRDAHPDKRSLDSGYGAGTRRAPGHV